MSRRLPIAYALLTLLLCHHAVAANGLDDYASFHIAGWTVRVHRQLASSKPELWAKVKQVVELQLYQINRVVAQEPLERLHKVTIWIELDSQKVKCACYHPNREWLKRNGLLAEKVKSVEIGNACRFLDWTLQQPWMLLHELAHAYHDRVLGYDYRPLLDAYNAAKRKGLYEQVLHHDGKMVRAYALNSVQEYFAEGSEAYFGTNDFYPFLRAELRHYDPGLYAVLKDIWGLPTGAMDAKLATDKQATGSEREKPNGGQRARPQHGAKRAGHARPNCRQSLGEEPRNVPEPTWPTCTTSPGADRPTQRLTRATTDWSHWVRHTIDNSSVGADGVRLADIDGDSRLDIVTGWEEGGLVRLYLNPGPSRSRRQWPAVTVGRVRSPEDAVLADLDADGLMDVVSCCEGTERTVFVHRAALAPSSARRSPAQLARQLLQPGRWRTEPIPATAGRTGWMFASPAQIDGQYGVDLFLGSKSPAACIGWLQAPAEPGRLERWRFHTICAAGWIMSLVPADVDGDADVDLIASDRKGPSRGLLWLENPIDENAANGTWRQHRIAAGGLQVMFIDRADLNGDRLPDLVAATQAGCLVIATRVAIARRHDTTAHASASTTGPPRWRIDRVPNPFGLAHGKSVRVADIDLDGRAGLVVSFEHAREPTQPGVAWLRSPPAYGQSDWVAYNISGPVGTKFDLVQLLDLDNDGDLDVLTCEERDNLGVVWYENPTR